MHNEQEALENMINSPHDIINWKEYWDMYIATPDSSMVGTTHFAADVPIEKQDSAQTIVATRSSGKLSLDTRDVFNSKITPALLSPSDSSSPDCMVKNDWAVPLLPKNAFIKVKQDDKSYFECTVEGCHKRFTRRAENAKAHWLQHKEIAPFACTECPVRYRRKHDLKRHVASLHGNLFVDTKKPIPMAEYTA